MIIDAHFHINLYPEHFGKDSAEQNLPKGINWWTGKPWTLPDMNMPAEKAIGFMDRAGVDKACLFGNAQMRSGWIVPTEFIAEAVRAYPERFIGFIMPNPHGGLKTVREIEKYVKEDGFKGVKLIASYNEIRFNDRVLWPYFEICQELGVAVAIHTGWGPYAYHKYELNNVDNLHEPAGAFPDVNFIACHAGFFQSEEMVGIMAKLPNVYCDFAYWGFAPIDKLARTLVWGKQLGVLDRMLFGTDFPWEDPAAEIARFRRMPEYTRKYGYEPFIDEADVEPLLGGNAARLLKLEPAVDTLPSQG
jgi:predicted TIM-barrel fold metal-dependent hydrolase